MAEEGAAAEIARCLEASSEVEGLRREFELLDARCPGVWLLGIGGTIDSADISFEKETDADPLSVGDGDAAAIFCERMVLVLSGEACWSTMSLDLAGWSAMFGQEEDLRTRRSHGRQLWTRGIVSSMNQGRETKV